MAAWRLILAAVLAAVFADCAGGRAAAQQIWLSVPRTQGRLLGMRDWEDMFQPTQAWAEVASRIQVYQFHVGLLDRLSDADMAAHFADLRQRHLAVAVMMEGVPPQPGLCGHSEGYAHQVRDVRVIGRLKRLGLKLDYMQMDAPLVAGHYDQGAQGCRYSVEELSRGVAEVTRPYLEAFPGIVLGEVEPIPTLQHYPDWQATLRAFRQGLEAAGGGRIAFIDCDMNWRRAGWDDALTATARFARAEGMRFSVIYDGDGEASDDAAWVASAIQHFTEVESRLGVIPDQTYVVSWVSHPTHVMPVTSPTTLGHTILEYRLPRTRIALSPAAPGQAANTITGQLVDEHGRPVAGAPIAVDTIGLDPTQPLPVLHADGTAPATARTGIVALRVNGECNCAGREDLLIGEVRYRETDGGAANATIDFAAVARAAAARGGGAQQPEGATVRVEQRDGQPVTHILASPAQTLALNAAPFPVTPGARFTLDAPAASMVDHDLSGGVFVVLLDAAGHGVWKTRLLVPMQRSALAGVVTGPDGRFMIPRQPHAGGRAEQLRFSFAGRADLRGAVAQTP
jgi:hypothetical protein